MAEYMVYVVAYLICPGLSLAILWIRQGKFLDDIQVLPCFMLGPMSLIIAMFTPKSMLTSASKAKGTDG